MSGVRFSIGGRRGFYLSETAGRRDFQSNGDLERGLLTCLDSLCGVWDQVPGRCAPAMDGSRAATHGLERNGQLESRGRPSEPLRESRNGPVEGGCS